MPKHIHHENLNTDHFEIDGDGNLSSKIVGGDSSPITNWDYEMEEDTILSSPVSIPNSRHVCLKKLPVVTPPSGTGKIYYYFEYEVEVPKANAGQKLIEFTLTTKSRVDALQEGQPYTYASGGGANLEPVIYFDHYDKYPSVFKGSFLLYNSDDKTSNPMVIDSTYINRGYDITGKERVHTDIEDWYPDGNLASQPNYHKLTDAELYPMFYFINEGLEEAPNKTLATIKKFRWKAMRFGDDDYGRITKISDYDERLVNRNKYDSNEVPIINNSGLLQSSGVTSTELGYLSGVSSSVQTQIDNINNQPKADAGALNTDTASDDWSEICKVGNISVEARYPTSDISPVRIVNSTGSTIVCIWSSIQGAVSDTGTTVVSDASSFLIANATVANAVKKSHSGIYTEAGVNSEAYTVDISIRRLAAGIRIACSIIGKF